jgi:hypothetical protein
MPVSEGFNSLQCCSTSLQKSWSRSRKISLFSPILTFCIYYCMYIGVKRWILFYEVFERHTKSHMNKALEWLNAKIPRFHQQKFMTPNSSVHTDLYTIRNEKCKSLREKNTQKFLCLWFLKASGGTAATP